MKLKININTITLILILFLIISVFSSYILNFNNGISNEQAIWGSFGDYIGGILNPLLTFITIIYLIKSHSLQQAETKEIQKENSLALYLRSLDQINIDLINFYETKSFIGSSSLSNLSIIEGLLQLELLNIDLEISSKIENEDIRLNRMFRNAIYRIPLKDANINDYKNALNSRINKSMLKKFEISTSIIKQILEISPEHPIPKLYLIDHEMLNKLFSLNCDIFK